MTKSNITIRKIDGVFHLFVMGKDTGIESPSREALKFLGSAWFSSLKIQLELDLYTNEK